ncbi:two-component system sensor histidine kinase NtrB [Desulfovibrio oxyclinae]|jgi:PAS domain S-box-containing protein|uniref:two-component system sensor histidine kinase NtrB n=1 Tax=Desulfovibrio oxyclinae TaxID=63560 RepID=UPI00036F4098|nr:ATP-binding protein [Desulfovibrio oxyclinae]
MLDDTITKDLSADKQYSIGVIGDIPALLAFWEMFRDQANDAVLREIGIVAAALPGQNALPGIYEQAHGIPLHKTWQGMLEDHPEINMVIEATGRQTLQSELRTNLPAHVTLVERDCANFFIRLLTSDKIWVACKLDLMHTQTMLKTIIDQLDEEILFLDLEGTILGCNKTVADRLGSPKRAIVGGTVERVFGPDEAKALEKTIKTGQSSESTATSVDHEGRAHYHRIYTYPISSEEGQVTHIVAMRRDITRRTHLEQRLQQSEKLASIGELSTYIAHEIRNPLFSISGFANSLMRSEGLDEKTTEKIQIILEESKRLDKILKSIMNFTRPTDADAREMNLNDAVHNTMNVMGIGFDEKNIRLILDLHPNVAKVKANEDQIRQSLINLVKNSVEAMPEGGELRIETGMNDGFVRLTVSDTGIGIPPDKRDKLFSPFYSTKGKGSGLGLAMIRKIMDELGGEVELVSHEGVGTTVTLNLPPVAAVRPVAQEDAS